MSAYSTHVGEKFARNTIKIYFEMAISDKITNNDYEGEIKGGGADRVNVLTYGALALKDYDGSDMSADDPSESEGTLLVDQKKAYYFKIKSWDKFKSYAEDPTSTLIQTAGKTLAETVDSFILGMYGDVGSGNWVGTDYVTGDCEVTVTTGAVTGNGTTFTADMVGKPFQAVGHTSWYRVKTFTSTTAIVIEDDKDDETSAYTGGAIASGTDYIVQANTAITATKATIYAQIVALRVKLNKAKAPRTDRFLVVNSDIAGLILQAPEFIPAVNSAYDEVVKRGLIGSIAGFTIYENEEVAGDNTDGFYCLAGHKSFITLAMAFVETGTEDLIGNFGSAYKGLNCYGAKVLDERRKVGALALLKV